MKLSNLFPSVLAGTLILASLSACVTKPTTVHENTERNVKAAAAASAPTIAPVEIKESTIVLDARTPYQYSLAHIPRAISLQWTDFTQPEESARGVLLADHFALARRLARLGITPESDVVVVGDGLAGGGEEWRLAWTLRYLGVEKVRAAPLSYFKGYLNNQPPPPTPAAPLWKPETEEALLVKRQELLNVLNKGAVFRPTTPPGRPEASPRVYKILDVRSPNEYLGKEGLASRSPLPNMEAINIEWKEFFDEAGLPNPAMIEKLHGIGITGENRIIVISEKGVRSAAVTLALKDLGFVDVGNYAGGLRDLVAAYRKPKAKK